MTTPQIILPPPTDTDDDDGEDALVAALVAIVLTTCMVPADVLEWPDSKKPGSSKTKTS